MFDVRLLRRGMNLLITLVTSSILQSVVAQIHSKPLPKFKDYPAKETFNGSPHPPILVTREQRRFRTRIREGVEKGWGVWINGEWGKEQNRPGPNFAGDQIVIVWGCGTGCLMMAVSDARTGTVRNPPLSAGGLYLPSLLLPMSTGRSPSLEFRRDSELMIIQATPRWDRPDPKSYAFYFLLQGDQWKLLRRVAITEEIPENVR